MEVKILKTCYGLQLYVMLDGVPVRLEQLPELIDSQTSQEKSRALASMELNLDTTVGDVAE